MLEVSTTTQTKKSFETRFICSSVFFHRGPEGLFEDFFAQQSGNNIR